MRDFPAQQIPSGWYMVGWSSDFPLGEPKLRCPAAHKLITTTKRGYMPAARKLPADFTGRGDSEA